MLWAEFEKQPKDNVHQVVAAEYRKDRNGRRAAITAGYAEESAAAQASRMLKKCNIAEEIDRLDNKHAKKADIDAQEVLQRHIDIFRADPTEVIKIRHVACRYCYGRDHLYQWRNEAEFQEALTRFNARPEAWQVANAHLRPTTEGGMGYRRLRPPHPQCPYCEGEGNPEIYVSDLGKLPPHVKALIKGVKETKNGIEVLFHDQMKALEFLTRFTKLEDGPPDPGAAIDRLASALMYFQTKGSSAPIRTNQPSHHSTDDLEEEIEP